MKRKFSFNMAPIKMSAKDAAEKPSPQPSPAHSASSSHSHKREGSKDSICDSSPYISRPVLDLQTEAELRAACRLILRNFKPSDHGMENTDPKLDFHGPNRRRDPRDQKQSVDVKVSVRVPTGAPVLVEGAHSSPFLGRKSSTKTRTRAKADMEIRARTQNEGPARANSSRKRADFGWLDDRDDKREQNLKKYGRSSMDQARPANQKTDDDEIVTPVTVASSYAYSKNASTAPTSASMTSGRSSNRRSRQIEGGEDKHDSAQPQARPSTAARTLSRTASLKNGLRRTLSRAQSKESLRKSETNDSQESESQPSGWRAWALPRRSLSRGSSRPGTSKGQVDDAEKKSEKLVNLNRELPPLPGLDTWKEPEEPKDKEEKAKSPTSPVHIASLMKPQDQQQDRLTVAHNPAHRRSGSDTLAVQYAQAFPVRTSSKPPLQIPPQPSRAAPTAPVNPESPVAVGTGSSSTSNLANRIDLGSSTHTRQRSGDTQPTTSDAKLSMDVPNFSRTFSMDAPSTSSYSNEVKIGKKEKDEQKSRLRKVFSGWMTRKQRKDQWMREIEKDGVKEGVLVQDQTAGAPVVRY